VKLARAFVSYARSDGEAFAAALVQRLATEAADIAVWRDRAQMQGGRDWWRQITDAMEQVDVLLLVMTPGALGSREVRREWQYARAQGVDVCPIKAPVLGQALDFASIPGWMSRVQFYDLELEWAAFLGYLRSPRERTRVPFMVPELPTHLAARDDLVRPTANALLSSAGARSYVALQGAGGFGKTTAAKLACHDDEVLSQYDDGVLWAVLGEQNVNVIRALTKMYAALTGERPTFVDENDAAVSLSERLGDRRCVIVVDDVWDSANLEHFLQGAPNCVRLVSTRDLGIATSGKGRVEVGALALESSRSLILSGIDDSTPGVEQAATLLGAHLGGWALLVDLAAAALRKRVALSQPLLEALQGLEHDLQDLGVTAFDQRNASERGHAIQRTMDVSLRLLSDTERQRYLALGVHPKDVDVPVDTVAQLWTVTPRDAERLSATLAEMSLLSFDRGKKRLRLHPVLQDFLTQNLSHQRDWHVALLRVWNKPYELPDRYAWRWYAHYLAGAERLSELVGLLLDYTWLRRKLANSDVHALLSDLGRFPEHPGLVMLRRALDLSRHVLSRDPAALPSQLLGRLGRVGAEDLAGLLEGARRTEGTWLRPAGASLIEPVGPLRRTLQVDASVRSVAVARAGGKVLVLTWENLSLYDLETISRTALVDGPGRIPSHVALSEDGSVSALGYNDGSCELWSLADVRVFRGFEGEPGRPEDAWATSIANLALTPGGTAGVLIAATYRGRLSRWDVATGERLAQHDLGDHLNAIAASPDGRKVALVAPDFVWLWNTETDVLEAMEWRPRGQCLSALMVDEGRTLLVGGMGELLAVDLTGALAPKRWTCAPLPGLTPNLECLAELPGRRVAAACNDRSIRVIARDEEHEPVALIGHTDGVTSVAVTGELLLSGSRDRTVRVWQPGGGDSAVASDRHRDRVVCLTLTPDGTRVLSTSVDRTIRVWDLASSKCILTLTGHRQAVTQVQVTPDGRRAVSIASWFQGPYERVAYLWDLESGACLGTLEGHTSGVESLVVLDDELVATGSSDRRVIVWDLNRKQAVAEATLSTTVANLRTTGAHREVVAQDSHGGIIKLSLEPQFRKVTLRSAHSTSGPTLGMRDYIVPSAVLALSPDRRQVVCSALENALEVVDIETGTVASTCRAHDAQVTAVLPISGDRVLSAGSDGTVCLWNLGSGELHRKFRAGKQLIWAVATTASERALVTGGDDDSVKVFGLESAEQLAEFTTDGAVRAVVTMGKRIVAGDATGRVHFLDSITEEPG
jgi:WD40 repeat protein